MDPAPLSSAKITKPRLQKVLPRRGLFRLMDKSRNYPAIWVCGPGGSGKTTSVASYIEEHDLSCLWYQIDEGDSDIATFFYYLAMAGKKGAPEKGDLPLLTPEYGPAPFYFTRRFFEDLFDRMPKPGALVLDNYQAVPLDRGLHGVIREALSIIPEGINVFILSRTEPFPVFARAVASNRLHVVGWQALRLQPGETEELVHLLSRSPLPGRVIDSLHRKTDGWIAGLILLLKRAEREGIGAESLSRFTAFEVFDYFRSEIFEKADQETRTFLLCTSVLPRMSARTASRLTGAADAEEILSRFRRNHWFTEGYPGSEMRYQYHPLFREYLLGRAAKTFSPEELTGLKRKAARLLEADGQIEPAVELFFESGDVHDAVQLILRRARMLVNQGRTQTLAQWLGRIPEEIVSKNPYGLYWLGVCRHHIDPDQGRHFFEEAFSIFETQEDTAGICVALCGILDSIAYGLSTLKSLDLWIPKLTELSREYEELHSPEIKGQLTASALFALTFRQPDHPELETWERRGFAVLKGEAPENIKLQVMIAFSWHRLFSGDLAGAGYFIDLYREKVQARDIPPYALCALKNMEAFHCFLSGRFEACRSAAGEALETATAGGVHFLPPLVLGHGAAGALSSGDFAGAKEQLQSMIQYENSSDWIFIYFHTLSLWKALLEKDVPKASLNAELGAAYIADTGVMMNEGIWYLGMALTRHASGQEAEAAGHLDKALSICRQFGFRQVEFGCYLAQAECAHDGGDETAARNALQRAMTLGKGRQYVHTWFWRPKAMARLCSKALEWDIEVEYVQELIRRRHLIPEKPPLEIENWPWPIEVYTLGRFSLFKDGKPLAFSKKAQEKPLALLKALIGLGGRHVSVHRAADLLWPDAEGDVAQGNLKTTLHRLRRLLGRPEAVRLNTGHLTLDQNHFWVDAWVFDQTLSKAEAIRESGADEEGPPEAAELIEKALEYYKGRLFQSDEGMAVPLREYMHHRFIQALEELGGYLQKKAEWERALALYERGLKIDKLVESFYRGVMICNERLGRKAEVLAAYTRCGKALEGKVQTGPSRETEKLKESLLEE